MVKTVRKKSPAPSKDSPLPAMPVPEIQKEASLAVEKISETPEEIPIEKKNRVLYFFSFIFVALIIFTSVTVYYLYQKEKSDITKLQTAQATPRPVSPTPNPFQTGDWSLEVLNGSGKAGTARKAAVNLSSLGFKVITVGNAGKSSYQNVNVYISKDLAKFESEFMKNITSLFPFATVSGLLEVSSPSARIIIGK